MVLIARVLGGVWCVISGMGGVRGVHGMDRVCSFASVGVVVCIVMVMWVVGDI